MQERTDDRYPRSSDFLSLTRHGGLRHYSSAALGSLIAATALLAYPQASYATSCTLPNTLTNGQTADATQVMANFTSLRDCSNGLLTLNNAAAINAKDPSGVTRPVLYGRYTDDAAYLDGGYGGTYFRTSNASVMALYLTGAGDARFSGSIYLNNAAKIMAKDPGGTDRTVMYGRYTDDALYLDGGTGGTFFRTNNANMDVMYLSAGGNVRFSHYGSGTLTTDSAGNITASSDERLKTINGAFNRGLSAVKGLKPILYHWNKGSGLDLTTQYAGFSAQNVQASIPEAVGRGNDGYLTINDRPMIAASVNAIQELAQENTTIRSENLKLKDTVAKLEEQLKSQDDRLSFLEAKLANRTVTNDSVFYRLAYFFHN